MIETVLTQGRPVRIHDLPVETLAAALDQSNDCVKIIGADRRVKYMNANGLCAMEIDDFQNVRGRQWEELWPEDSRAMIRDACATASRGETARLRAFCPTAKGAPRWWDVTVSPVRGTDGEHLGYLGISRDVSEQQKSRTAIEAAAAELRHRLKNTYQLITILLGSFARGDKANEAFASDMNKRIVALSRAQALSADGDETIDIGVLIPALMQSFMTPDCTVAIDASGDLRAAQGQADAIALIFGELAVNAAKYGAVAHGGRIAIRAAREGDRLALRWAEQSNGKVPDKSRAGSQGLPLITANAEARDGSIAFDWGDQGVTVDMSFPAA